ncbi:T9SS type A sorting domain-containing protein [Hymenobacter sp. RP-2-7]|uniref:T9SS type A sorting domain-containing protein n=1 Tax=Hymenobacter polaris TaxID=2682546 RepID=A0A7Y0AH39_9BACT|nr:T9SS type A sorting domain-containing protein [Hymenobacter polaris]NML67264.1 T9SS type A sorting domain-containing protein [Hymenobacter polaris]
MKQKNFTLSHHSGSIWSGYLSKLVALVLLVGGLGATQQVWGQTYNYDDIYITAQPTGTSNKVSTVYNGTYSTNDQNATADFQGADLGNGANFDQSTGALTLTAVTANINSNKAVQSSSFYYRVYLVGTSEANKPKYTSFNMGQTSSANTGMEVTFASDNLSIDLLNQPTVLGGGTYVVEAKFAGVFSNASRNNPNGTGTIIDPQNTDGSGFKATFQVISPAVTPTGGTTTWQSTSSTEWELASNWSNGVPNSTSNAVIPAQTTPSASIVYPILNNPNYNYSVNNLTLQGTTSSTSSALTINAATLTIYGNLSQGSGGLTGNTVGSMGKTDSKNNSTLVFAGKDQVITGNLVVSDIIIAGSGTKSVINQLNPSNILAFRPTSVTDGVIVQSASQDLTNGTVETSFSTTGTSYIQLGASAIISLANNEAETTTSYVKGVLRADRTLTAGTSNSFGNIGLDVTPNHSPGSIYIYRVVGDALSSPQNNSPAKPIKRQYQIVGDDDSNSSGTAGSTVDVVFHYLPSADELNGIDENNLTLFRTTNKGRTYQGVGGDLNTTLHTVSRNNLPTLTNYILTLGDKTNPLPVSLVAFNAVRSNANTLLSWITASEENNKGFNVQVSADGVTYRTLTFVASKSPNSSNEQSYKYTDTEAGKVGTRYYRLEQVDVDGKLNYSPVRAVGFDGTAATSVALVAYPNPFSNTIGLTVEGATTTEGSAYVKLVDMTGRTVLDQKVSLVGASLALGDLSNLRSGLYLAKVTLPDGSVQTVRVQKQ